MKGLFIVGCFLMLNACATIGPEHEQLSRHIERGIEKNEEGYTRLIKRLEEVGRKFVDLEMMTVHGPNITKHMVRLKDKNGKTFVQKFCKKTGELDRAREALKFMLALSRKFEQRKQKELKPLIDFVKGLQSVADREYLLMRQGAGSLTLGLRAYNKDKKWKQDMLRSFDVPVDQAEALNRSGNNLRKQIDSRLK